METVERYLATVLEWRKQRLSGETFNTLKRGIELLKRNKGPAQNAPLIEPLEDCCPQVRCGLGTGLRCTERRWSRRQRWSFVNADGARCDSSASAGVSLLLPRSKSDVGGIGTLRFFPAEQLQRRLCAQPAHWEIGTWP